MNASVSGSVALLLAASVVGSAGWIVTHFVNNVVSVPTMEYVIEDNVDFDDCTNSSIAVTVRNLSRTQKFTNIKLILRLPVENAGTFKAAEMNPIPPAYRSREKVERDEKAVSYPGTGIHPGTALKLSACYSGDHMPTFHIAEGSDVVWPVERGLLTLIIHNEICVLLGLLII